MAQNVTDTDHMQSIPLPPVGEWAHVDVAPSQHPAARPFAPPFVDAKPTLYIPVKRKQDRDTFPQLEIQIRLGVAHNQEPAPLGLSPLEEINWQVHHNLSVPPWVGAKVNVTVRNMWGLTNQLTYASTSISGTLDDRLVCQIRVPAATVKQWLDPSQALGARVNKNLLDFHYEIPSIQVDGKPVSGQSVNRVYLYRRKVMVFLPGVFASEFEVAVGKDKVAAFPDFVKDKSNLWFLEKVGLAKEQMEQLIWDAKVSHQKVGLLECDAQGKPLLEAVKPMLLRLGPKILPGMQVADFFNQCHEARNSRLVAPVPEDFLLFELRVFCYDWRGDLTTTAKQMVKRLKEDQARLPDDTDDKFAIIGHSTGGVLIRRMLGEGEASSLISHVFFVNVPFRGAPKALGVILTGCDPPGGDPMIPLIDPPSLVSIATTEPIVYHLAPSASFPSSVIQVPGGCENDREKEKAKLLEVAVQCGMWIQRAVVVPEQADDRVKLGLGAAQWADYWDRLGDWSHARIAFLKWNVDECAALDQAQLKPLESDPVLKSQGEARKPIGWNTVLAEAAREFHAASEAAAGKDGWAPKTYIFYSTGSDTTQQIRVEKVRDHLCYNLVALIEPNPVSSLPDGTARPSKPSVRSEGVEYEQWLEENGKLYKRFWKLYAVRDKNGDGTVPLCSQLGFGGPAHVFRPLPGGPEHANAPNTPWLWRRILDVLLEYDVTRFLVPAGEVNTTTGVELKRQPKTPEFP